MSCDCGKKNNECRCKKALRCKTTLPASFPGYQECDKLDPKWIDAYVEIKLDPENPTGIILDSSWGEIKLDLLSIVKAGETITHLELAPEDDPTVIRYINEAGDYECITGDELSRIISLHLLKDIDQSKTLENGDVYVYNSSTHLFEPYDVLTAVTNLNTYLGRLEAEITNIKNRLTTIEGKLTPPADAPNDVKVAFGNINVYSDVSNTDLKTSGLYTHTLATDVTNDEYFS